MNKPLEKTIFLFFVHEVLATHKMALTWDGQYEQGQMIARLEGSFSKENGRFAFSSKGLTQLGERYGLKKIEKVFQKTIHPRFDSVYRFTFEKKDLDMKKVARTYEAQRSIVFAEPNYTIYSYSELEGGAPDALPEAA